MGLLRNRVPGSAAPVPPATNGAAATSTPWIPPVPPVAPRKLAIKDELGTVGIAKNSVAGAVYKFSNGGILGMFLSAVDKSGQILYSFIPVDPVTGVGGGTPFPVGPDEATTLVAHPPEAAAPAPAPVPPPPAAPPLPPVPTVAAVPALPPPPPAAPAAPALPPIPGVPLITRVTAPPLPALPPVPTAAPAPTEKKTRKPRAFQRWEGALAASVRAGLPPAGDYVIYRGSKISEIVAETLIPFCAAGNVIRAF